MGDRLSADNSFFSSAESIKSNGVLPSRLPDVNNMSSLMTDTVVLISSSLHSSDCWKRSRAEPSTVSL